MVAVAILAISLLALINFQGQSMFIVGRAEKLTLANFLARQKMAEVVLAIEKEQFQQGVFSEDKSESGAFEEPYEDYKWEWKMRKVEIPVPEVVKALTEGWNSILRCLMELSLFQYRLRISN